MQVSAAGIADLSIASDNASVVTDFTFLKVTCLVGLLGLLRDNVVNTGKWSGKSWLHAVTNDTSESSDRVITKSRVFPPYVW